MNGPLVDRFRDGFPFGLTLVTREGEPERDTGMDFGVYVARKATVYEDRHEKETAWLLLEGQAEVRWDGEGALVRRESLFDEAPTLLHLPPGTSVRLTARSAVCEWAVVRASNERTFAPRLFRPEELTPEYRGQGLVQDASLRNVRLIFDDTVRPESELVIGEVVNYPGRWSSYPPHHHSQPEIYHYRFTEPRGYGHAELGERVFQVKSYDTLKILDGVSHAQVAAPGYGMWYLWAVRHLPGNRYTGFTFSRDHEWVLDPARQGWKPPEGPA